MKKLYSVLAFLLVASMVLAACAPAATPTAAPTNPPAAEQPTAVPPTAVPPTAVPPTEAPTAVPPTAVPTAAPAAKLKICNVNDMGGVDDKSFNATAWKGTTDAIAQLGVDGKYLESNQATDYEKNLNAFVTEKCDLIISVGFLLADATKKVAEANPDMKFAIIDNVYDPPVPNILASAYDINTATYLAGYLSAAMSKTGVIGTFGGMQFPAVTSFMDGFQLGMEKYNEVHGKSVKLLGWDMRTQKGLFTGDFSDVDKGKNTSLSLLDEGADIIMPVAGPVGAGTLAAEKERNTGMLIGVDTDWAIQYPDSSNFILASALKKMNNFVLQTVKDLTEGKFAGGTTWIGTLSNDGVGLGINPAQTSNIPPEIITEIDQLKQDIIDGKIKVEVPK